MSAFMVGRQHINAMVTVFLYGPTRPAGGFQRWEMPRHHTYITQDHERNEITPDELGQLLWRENYRSVMGRYPDCNPDNLPGPNDFSPADIAFYTFERSRTVPTVAQTYNMLRCYEYQSCEHDDWQTSPAHRFVEQLKDKLFQTYEDVKRDNTWEWTDE